VVAVTAPIPRPGPPPNRPVAGPPPPAGNAAGQLGAGPQDSAAGQDSVGGEDSAAAIAALQDSVADLDQLDDLPVADHVARYDALHGTLSEALAAIDGV
jgi:hypothetical protein